MDEQAQQEHLASAVNSIGQALIALYDNDTAADVRAQANSFLESVQDSPNAISSTHAPHNAV